MDKKWSVFPEIEEELKQNFPEINPVVLQLLFNRGIKTQEDIDKFLSPEYSVNLHDPFLFSQMERAVKRIYQAKKEGEKILIYGDYDVDGVTSSMLVFDALKQLGFKDVCVHLPDREKEGYGMQSEVIKKYAKEGIKLIITVDCGISNKEQIAVAKKEGIDVVVTDHHSEPPELPKKAVAIINPKVSKDKYPFSDLAGVGVAFKLACALFARQEKYLDEILVKPGIEKWFLDLVALGTIGDMMKLVDENRTMVKYGLVVLNKTKRQGIKSLLKQIGIEDKNIDSQKIGFQIGPRINAAGRIGHANTALSLLMSDIECQAEKIADQLDQDNKERRSIIEKIIRQSEKQIEDSADNVFFVLGDDWPTGVVGLVAGRLMNRYYRPTLAMSSKNGEITGSGRSIEEVNIIEILQDLEKYLSHYGGHPRACGFTLKSEKVYDEFVEEFKKLVDKQVEGKVLLPKIDIDARIKLADVNWDLQEALEKFEPFGEGNPGAKFLLDNLEVVDFSLLGKNENHLRLMVRQGSIGPKKMMGFFMGNTWAGEIKIGDRVDAVVELSVNQWNGTQELELRIEDLKKVNYNSSD